MTAQANSLAPGLSAPPAAGGVMQPALLTRLRRRYGLSVVLIAILLVLVVLPAVFMFVGALMSGGMADPNAHFTLQKLRLVYTTWPYLHALGFTLMMSGGVAALATVVGVATAWLVARTDIPRKGFLELCLIAPLFLSPFVGGLAWLILGSPKSGLINVMARDFLGLRTPLINVVTTTGIVCVMALYFVPYAYLTVSSSLRNMDPAMEEASYLNGAGIVSTALRITLPVLRPALISAYFFIFVLAAGTFSIPAVLGGASRVPFLAVIVFQTSASYPIDYGKSAAVGTVLFWVSVMGVMLYRFASQSARRFVTVTARGFRIRQVRLRGWRGPAMAVIAVYVLLAIGLPYLALIYTALTRYITASVLHAPWTLDNVMWARDAPEVTDSIVNTLLVGVVTPTICVGFAVLLAFAIRRLRVPFARTLDYLAMFPIAIPGIVLGTGIFWTYVTTPVYGTIWILVLAFLASYLPFAYRISDTALLQIDKSWEEASSLCGAAHGRTLWRVTVPLIRPALLSAWVMVFIFSVREISAAILLASPSNEVLSTVSWNYLDYGDQQKAAVLGLIQTVILIGGVLMGQFVFRVRLTQAV
ncbi:iron ABC transporter permease [Acidisphaera sp. L21]|uniref:ABC transporter permease n=1 Tax=Acidisphaera sp. L21 TaxID=1641851 RepID=UPI00131B1A0D|nr:iron ABC transporter permease [Acidisphaera sp. L21]